MAGLLEWLSSQKDSAANDYADLMSNYPNAQKFGSGLIKSISEHIPTQEDYQSPEKMFDFGMSVAPMGMTVKNTNAKLLKKYLGTGKLSPKEMAEYEANALEMETPQLQRYNVANAMANPEMQAYKDTLNMPGYHGTNDVITAPDYAFSGKGADQLGSSALYTSAQPSLASGYVKPDISGGNVLPLALRNTNKYMSDELEKKLTPAQIREFITKSPDEDALWNFGDVGYEGKNKVINTAVQGYHQYGDEKLLDTLNTLNNDFYRGNPEEFNKLAEKLTKKAGVVMDTGENKIYAPWNTKDIRSRFAAFDPLRKNSSSLLASGLLGSLLLNNEMKNSENR
jgi:hypothetical protein